MVKGIFSAFDLTHSLTDAEGAKVMNEFRNDALKGIIRQLTVNKFIYTATRLYNDSLNLNKSISKFIASLKSSPITGLKNLKRES